jgi:hypothetical protein
MKKQIAFILLCSSLLLPFSTPLSIGCGGYDEPDITESLLFNPRIIGQEALHPLFITYRGLFDGAYDENAETSNSLNLKEWEKRYPNFLSTEELSWLLYQSTAEEIADLQKNKYTPFGKDSTLTVSLSKKINKATTKENDLQYLHLAKQAESLSVNYYYYWEERDRDTIALKNLMVDLRMQFMKCTDPFLKGRYGFQFLKTAHYSGEYQTGIDFYESNLRNDIAFSKSIQWRNKGYYAACLYKAKRYTESNLLYCDIFKNYVPQKIDAILSFHPQEETDWNEMLAKANTEQLKTLWLFYGIYNDPIKGIEEITKLDPVNTEMELLLMRAVNIAEYNIISNPVYNWDETHYFEESDEYYKTSTLKSWKSVNKANLDRLITTINTRLKASNIGTQPWLSAKAYLQFLKNDLKGAQSTLNESLLKSESNALAQKQNNISTALIYASNMQAGNQQQEEAMADMLIQIKNDETPVWEAVERYILRQLAKKYESSGEDAKKMLCSREIYSDFSSRGNLTILRDFMERNNLNRFEQYLCNNYLFKLANIYDLEGTELMYQYNWENAIAAFSQHPDAGTSSTYSDPFIIHINDCHDCDHSNPNSITYTKINFSKRMAELLKEINSEKNKNARSKLCFEYANGLYNMTWFGNARVLSLTDIHYSVSSPFNSKEDKYKDPYFDCSEAGKWYEQARTLTSDKEFAAKCAWMSAKCEHANWLNSISEEEPIDFVAGKYFQLLKSDYSRTNYYQEIIQECGYFCTFNYGPLEKCIRNKEE